MPAAFQAELMKVALWLALLATAEATCGTKVKCQSVLRSKPKDADAWLHLGLHRGGCVRGVPYSQKQCYEKSASLNPKSPLVWFSLGNHGGGHVGRLHFTRKACFEKALSLNPKYVSAWINLGGYCGGGHVAGEYYSPLKCYEKALSLNPKEPNAWANLGVQGGGTVGGHSIIYIYNI